MQMSFRAEQAKTGMFVGNGYDLHMARGSSDRAVDARGIAPHRKTRYGLIVAEDLARHLHGSLSRDRYTSLYVIDFGDGKEMMFDVDDRDGYLLFNELEAYPLGEGIGSRFLDGLRSFADQRGQDLRFCDVLAPDFFDRFDWLEEVPTGVEHEQREIIDYWYRRG